MKQQASKTKAIKKSRQLRSPAAGGAPAGRKKGTDRYLAQLQTAFNTAPVGLAILDADLRYVRVNKTLATMDGVPAEEHTGRTVRDVVPGIADEVEKTMQVVFETGNPVCNIHFITPAVSRPGGVRHWNEHWFPLKDKDGRIFGVSAVVEEITDRIRIEEALDQYKNELEQKVEIRTRELKKANEMLVHRNEELLDTLAARKKMEQDLTRLTTAIYQAGEGIVLYGPDWVIEYVNPAYERLTGYSREELIGKGVDFLVSQLVEYSQPDVPCKAASRGEIWSGHVRRRTKSGEVIDTYLTASPVRNREGETINYVGISKDITREVRLHQVILQSQKMEAIGTLAGGIAHDLKNIFTPILINSEMAVQDVGRDSPAYPLLEEILEAAGLGINLVKQIMTFARQTSEEKVEVDVSSVVSETLSLLRSAIPKTIEIKTVFSTGDTLVWANPTRIKQVLMNLGSNAAYAMRGRPGLLKVDVCCVDLDRDATSKISPGLPSGSYVEVDVIDTGEGMGELTLQHIFDPFFTTKQPGEGTGMGLSVVQEIIRDHRGAISVWSRPGRGSTFRVLLPHLGKGSVDRK